MKSIAIKGDSIALDLKENFLVFSISESTIIWIWVYNFEGVLREECFLEKSPKEFEIFKNVKNQLVFFDRKFGDNYLTVQIDKNLS